MLMPLERSTRPASTLVRRSSQSLSLIHIFLKRRTYDTVRIGAGLPGFARNSKRS